MKPVSLALLLALLLVNNPARAQEPPPPPVTADTLTDTLPPTLPLRPADTVRYQRTADLDRFRPATDSVDMEQHLYQNPTVALFKSMVIPGWGQFSNHSYVKAVLFFGVDAWLVGSAISHGLKASDHFDKYESASTVDERNLWYDRYDDERSQRNKFTWFAVIVSFISMFDAYVDAHFSGFPDANRDRTLGLDIAPDSDGGINASVALTF